MKRLTTKEFIEKAKAVHGEKYGYEQVEYVNHRTKVSIVCPTHGEFKQVPNGHLAGNGCHRCAGIKKLTTEEFIKKATEVHGEYYEYVGVEYLNGRSKVDIVCPIHGKFLQTANDHLSGHGCRKCGFVPIQSTQNFIDKAISAHGDKYGYELTEYKDKHTKVKIQCYTHGIFIQSAQNHLRGSGCPQCSPSRRLTTDDFITRSDIVHKGKYGYDKATYINSEGRVTITCREHGDFEQIAKDHWNGCGCPTCGSVGPSTGEVELANFIESIVDVQRSDRKTIAPSEIDISIHSKKLGVEFCGTYFHSDKFRPDNYHLKKLQSANDVGYDLIQVFDDEWRDKPEIVKSIISSRLGAVGEKLFARNTFVSEVGKSECENFLKANHIQGSVNAEVRYGLYLGEELVMVSTFSKDRKVLGGLDCGWFELVRLCTKMDTVVAGGFSKLLKHFIKTHSPKGIKTFCDKRYFNGRGYEAVGFIREKDSTPGYFYIKALNRYSRYKFQKHKLAGKLKAYDAVLSEKENMKNNGYLRVYDCGNAVYKMDLSSRS